MSPVSRNAPCPCGSGRRFKLCCGALSAPGSSPDQPAGLEETLFEALRLQQGGDLRRAEALYRRAMLLAPADPDALHMLGTVCMSSGKLGEAFSLIYQALEVSGWKWAPMRYNLGLVVTELMRAAGADGAGGISLADLVGAAARLVEAERRVEQFRLWDSRDPVVIAASRMPEVSIVVPVFGKHEFTYSCLRSIAQETEGCQYEVIVVDDASPQPAAQALAMVEGVRWARSDANSGFVASCNLGARLAQGRILLFLNNDTLVTRGWLSALVAALRLPGAGLVGAKLIYPDGSLQEAGCILWRGAVPSQYGRRDDPGKPEFNFVRDVDYCSGACLAIEKSLFDSVGGFDTRYSPAYYEDTDLAMRVRESGRRVLYQPAAVVVHFEGATSGTDLGSGAKAYQAVNQSRFAARWASRFAHRRVFPERVDLEKDGPCRGRILVVDAYIPMPDQDSGSVRMFELLGLLKEAGWRVSFAALSLEFKQAHGVALQQMGVEVLHAPYYFALAPLLLQRGADLDVIVASRLDVAEHILPLARKYASGAKLIFDTVDLHFLRAKREAALLGSAEREQGAEVTERRERAVMRAADLTLVVSDAEKALLAELEPGVAVEVLSNIHRPKDLVPGFEQRKDMFFVGGYRHPPNVDAVLWFVGEIWPLIRARLPGVRVFLIGSNMPPRVAALSGGGVEALGHVPDLEPFLSGCRLALAPLRYGAGVKGKVNSAQAHGVPVACTSVAAEGMHLQPGRDVLLGDTPSAFAEAVVLGYEDAALWQRLSMAGLENVRRHFSREAAREALGRILPPGCQRADA